MPRGVVSAEPQTFQLKTCPPDGYITLKKMTWGEYLKRQELSSDLSIQQQRGSKTQKVDIDITTQKVVEYEFALCIVDHNITDEQDNPLDLKNPFNIRRLDPQIAQEISKYIGEMNDFEDDLENLPNGSKPASSEPGQ